MELLYANEAYNIQGAAFEVYKEMGCGFLEAVYQECLENEFLLQGIPFSPQHMLTLNYKGKELEQTYKPDFICYDKIIVEIKAVKEFTNEHLAQVLNYLKASGMELGILINFGSYPKAETKRLIWSH